MTTLVDMMENDPNGFKQELSEMVKASIRNTVEGTAVVVESNGKFYVKHKDIDFLLGESDTREEVNEVLSNIVYDPLFEEMSRIQMVGATYAAYLSAGITAKAGMFAALAIGGATVAPVGVLIGALLGGIGGWKLASKYIRLYNKGKKTAKEKAELKKIGRELDTEISSKASKSKLDD